MKKWPTPKKQFGQHFLNDQNIINEITNNFSKLADVIVEVGPGPATLTKNLSIHQRPFFLIEKDFTFKERLLECVSEENIFFTDALKFDWNEFINENNFSTKNIWLVSNLPYNVSVPLLIQFSKVFQITYLSLMFQKEVADKIFLNDISGNNNSLYVLMNNYFDISLLKKAPPGAFYPPPKVHSTVLSFIRKQSPEVPLEEFLSLEKFLRDLFQFRRKKIINNLSSSYSVEKLKEGLKVCDISENDRAHNLSFAKIIKLYKSL